MGVALFVTLIRGKKCNVKRLHYSQFPLAFRCSKPVVHPTDDLLACKLTDLKTSNA